MASTGCRPSNVCIGIQDDGFVTVVNGGFYVCWLNICLLVYACGSSLGKHAVRLHPAYASAEKLPDLKIVINQSITPYVVAV